MVGWILKLCNMAFESGVVYLKTFSWSAVIVPLYKGKGERSECKSYRGISWQNIYRHLDDKVRIVTGDLTDNEQGGFRADLHTKSER